MNYLELHAMSIPDIDNILKIYMDKLQSETNAIKKSRKI